ncbi:hypothetical protein GCM10010954_16310 [Halobacillus andaensis]|uniref:Uncharacterized protein n=1 Tax=Halobacillus andaensis TaxID=1176239 RepID=A0A917B212_HALAA|nr:hypothetical protein [Halobacillus andaensis]MBP2004867.1 hypothetical protein [Halobacillus andaensis]GGF18297.1 hypothetical protein GCM10010954_16310 [Halobacillus andaensis]
MRKLLSTLAVLLSLIAAIAVTAGVFIGIVVIQEKLFVPGDHLMWIFKYPFSRFVLIYQLLLMVGVFYVLNKKMKRKLGVTPSHPNHSFLHKNRRLMLSIFIFLNLALFYILISAVTVIKEDEIRNYSYLSPQGEDYRYEDVVKVEAGVYGDRFYLPFTHDQGDFYYVIELPDGSKVDLTEVGGVKGQEDERFVIEDIDRELVDKGVPKDTSLRNFEYTKDHLAKKYTDSIHRILENK